MGRIGGIAAQPSESCAVFFGLWSFPSLKLPSGFQFFPYSFQLLSHLCPFLIKPMQSARDTLKDFPKVVKTNFIMEKPKSKHVFALPLRQFCGGSNPFAFFIQERNYLLQFHARYVGRKFAQRRILGVLSFHSGFEV